MDRFVNMACVGPHMGVMEAVVTRSGAMLKVITFVSNKGLASATRMVKEIIITPIAVVQWAVVAIVEAVIVHWPVRACARR
jgi:hypothetical protein